VALDTVKDHAIIQGLSHGNVFVVDFGECPRALSEAPEELKSVAHHTESTRALQRICDLPTQIITLQREMIYHIPEVLLALNCRQ
jgi:hypothetical protein